MQRLTPPQPMHLVRAVGGRATAARFVLAVPAYAAGHFTALVREHNWPPRWQSQWPQRSGAAASLETRQRWREGSGFQALPLNLPGAVAHADRWRKQRAAAGQPAGRV